MKKENRVLKNHEFSEIITSGKYWKTPSFVFYVRPRRQDHARVGISVSKKLGNAPQRNLVKRQVRSMVDSVFHFNEDYDTICIVRPIYRKNSYQENLAQMQQAKERLSHLKGDRKK